MLSIQYFLSIHFRSNQTTCICINTSLNIELYKTEKRHNTWTFPVIFFAEIVVWGWGWGNMFSLLLAEPIPPPPPTDTHTHTYKNEHTDAEDLKTCRVFYLCVKNLFKHILYITYYSRGFTNCFPGFASTVSKPLKLKKTYINVYI